MEKINRIQNQLLKFETKKHDLKKLESVLVSFAVKAFCLTGNLNKSSVYYIKTKDVDYIIKYIRSVGTRADVKEFKRMVRETTIVYKNQLDANNSFNKPRFEAKCVEWLKRWKKKKRYNFLSF